jgi:hypothetical protein
VLGTEDRYDLHRTLVITFKQITILSWEMEHGSWSRITITERCYLWHFEAKCKGKGQVVPVLLLTEHHAMKAYWGSGGIAPLIL